MDVMSERDQSTDELRRLVPYGAFSTVCGVGGVVMFCGISLFPTLRVLGGASPESMRLPWDVPHGAFCVGLDHLSAFFLLPILVLSALAAVYGGNYMLAYRRQKSLIMFWFFYNTFVAGMVMVVIARTALLFLLSWEVMSLSAYFLVTFEHEKAEVRRAGWIYLVATHLGAAFLFGTFLILGRQAGSLEFDGYSRAPAMNSGLSGLIFVFALIGFGAKAGFVPFHVWLPEAHPAAPSHVSAMMSGVMIKVGLYGLLRVVTFIGPPAPWWGLTLAIVGLCTALVGISLALSQRDVKRVLAYSSIENMGLIGLAFGVGLWGWASSMPVVAILGMSGGMLHIWNHALMKGLMFLAAGSVLHGTGTKDMEKLGGLMKRMPWTGGAMITGAVAISALPPLNGFVSEWLMYLALLKCGLETSGGRSLAALLAVGLVALVGGLATISFVRLTGIVLLGRARSDAARRAHESSPWMIAPMAVLVFLCVTIAVIPRAVASVFPGTIDQVLGGEASRRFLDVFPSAAPLATLGTINAWTFVALGVVGALVVALTRQGVWSEGPTWGCGYLTPSPRIQYTGRSFAELMAEQLLPRFLRPKTTRRAPHGLFPSRSEFESACPDPMSENVYEPFFGRWAERFSRLRILQQGKVSVYLVYIVLTVVLALAWVSIRGYWGNS
jgi:hydrogenase-4 component B